MLTHKQKDALVDAANEAAARSRGLVLDLTTCLHNRNHALAESVKLQSHYAGLLNQMDGGTRLQFANAEEWEARLRSLNERPAGKPGQVGWMGGEGP